ncbi:MAG: PIN domain protein [Candidatus Methanofastidiosum methylothiophilum]|uniref:PIN domain protein n=1 Tax=Candidatus Methanofastidiosum methylothiophilum TaxID=1705564 RepID=A0A150IUW9_9EURY|nr:MAG: PIN domain protein [Candidatus Methanofastidiosum methylthiophilus]KYC49896.1 MAG: PIN domain protein [Candidatus Methanofastidiosum methylthiophilus]
MYLLDTNILLEILLNQRKAEKCKEFIDHNIEEVIISDFSLHSIGVILLRYEKEEAFNVFIRDIAPTFKILSLPLSVYTNIYELKREYDLDFDDAYNFKISEFFNLILVTMDKDFDIIKDADILFL